MLHSSPKIPRVIPVFPLPNVVLFPRVYLPLHIFEPRYREMVRDSLVSSKIIAMVLLKSGWERDYFANPEIYSVGCAGEIVSVTPLADGKYHIVLNGLEEVRFGREFTSKSYREAEVEASVAERDRCLHDGERGGLQCIIHQYLGAKTKDPGEEWSHQLLRLLEDSRMDDEGWVNFFSFSLDLSWVEKQSLLEVGSLNERGERLREILKFHLVEQSFMDGKRIGSGSPN
jgi:Lon protease-like protein